MITRKSIVDQVEVTRNGTVQVRIALLLVEGDAELQSRWHRTAVAPGSDPGAQMALVNKHLEALGEALLAPEDIDRVVAIFNAVPTA